MRDNYGNHLLDASAFNDVLYAIQHECGDDILVQITTESLGPYNAFEQAKILKESNPKRHLWHFVNLF